MRRSLFLLLAMFSSFIYASDGAKVIYVKGDVTLSSNSGSKKAVIKRMEVFAEDVIETSENSFCVISFPEGSKLKIDQNSKIKIEKLSFVVEGIESDDTTLYLMSGRLLLNIVKKSTGDDFQIKTGVAAIGVRGTEFMASLEDDDLWVGADDGLLEITTPSGEKGFLEAGKGVVVEKKSGFTEPKSYSWVKNARFGSDSNFSSFKDFRSEKQSRVSEFRKKRQKWTKRKEHSKAYSKMWSEKRQKVLEKRKSLKSSSTFKNKLRKIKKRETNRFKKVNSNRIKNNVGIEKNSANTNKKVKEKLREKLQKIDNSNKKKKLKRKLKKKKLKRRL